MLDTRDKASSAPLATEAPSSLPGSRSRICWRAVKLRSLSEGGLSVRIAGMRRMRVALGSETALGCCSHLRAGRLIRAGLHGDGVADVDDALVQNLGSQPATMDQAAQHAG